ncbi:MAG: glutathione S-transferase family protein [Alphaproteobacteria bacterium]|nr:glutathione S-transferase family protein [Alphaproteobacteria bacterium]
MSLVLHGHPFSSYTQKVLMALYENATPFDWRVLDGPPAFEELARLWPIRLMPLLVDDGTPIAESSIIVEHLALSHPGPVRLIPNDPQSALKVRFLDRFFDLYVMTPMQRIVGDKLRQESERDPKGVRDGRARLDVAYAWLDKELAGREWAAGQDFGLADCAAAPSLFYADWAHPIGALFANVRAYRARLLKRPSFARAVEEARPFRKFFPLGAPDRD